MPGPVIRKPDVASFASRLPAPVREPYAILTEFARQLLGDVPSPATTTIGPGAFPLDKIGNQQYERKVVAETLKDMYKHWTRDADPRKLSDVLSQGNPGTSQALVDLFLQIGDNPPPPPLTPYGGIEVLTDMTPQRRIRKYIQQFSNMFAPTDR